MAFGERTQVGDASVTHIAFIGMMASGKSTVGRLVADRLGRPLVDVDDVIEAQTAMTVKQLWERGGEAAYRPLERDAVIHTLSESHRDVLAAPGGVVVDHLVVAAFEAADVFVVWLRAEPDALAERAAESGHRPLLGADPRAALRTMAVERADAYAALADVTLDIEDRSPPDLAELVLDALPRTPAD